MDRKRREILRAGSGAGVLALAAAAGLLRPEDALAEDWNKAAFESRSFVDALKVLGAGGSSASKDIQITAPEIAENGAVVPVAVEARLAKTQMIAIILEKNPTPLAATFEIPDGTDAFVSTRVKMAETSNVHVLVKADGKFFHAMKEVKVTLGGCGG